MDIVFDKWCEKLLDTGKGNRLINFKESKLRTVDILSPDTQTVFNKVENGDTLYFYEVDDYIRRLKDDEIDCNEEDKNQGKFDKVTKQQVVDALSDKLKKNQILSYKKGFTIHKILSSIKKIANTSLVEKGINILYLAFGFLNWKEKEESDIWYSSPLVLIPISLNNESTTLPFELVQYEDEVNTNPTLIYKLKNEFGMTLPEFRDSNEDETITEYFERVQKLVEKKGWSVKDNMAIGTFSFLKLNMYKDLKENEKKILANPTIKKLLNREVPEDKNIENIDIDDYFKKGKELTLHNVVDADSSQMSAIIKAKSGRNLVLQGPPGTGKSQTITNLIAEFLYDGKKILFVSEKLAALNVVFNNLKKAGLSDFCLELHSNKTNKKDVISELYRVLNSNKKSIKETASAELDELKKAKEQLDKYADTMHTLQPCINKTPYQILGVISKYHNIPTFEYAIDNIQEKDNDYLKDVLVQLDYFIKFSENVGYDYRKNAWYGYINEDSTYQTKISLKKQLTQILEFAQKYSKELKLISKKLSVELLNNNIVKDYIPYITELSNLEYFDNNFFDKDILSKLVDKVKKYNQDTNDYVVSKNKVKAVFNDELFEINTKDYYLRFKNDYISAFRFFNGNYRRDKKVLSQYLNNKKNKLKYPELVELLKEAKNTQQLEATTTKDKQEIIDLLSNKSQDFNWKKLENTLDKLNSTMNTEIESLKKVDYSEFKSLQTDLSEFIAMYEDSGKQMEIIDKLQESFDKNICDFNQMNYDSLIKKIKNLLDSFDNIEYWIRFYGVLHEIDNLGLIEFIDKSIDSKIERATLDQTFKLMFYTQWMYYILDKNNILHNFSRLTQDTAVANFKKKDKLKFEISKAEIVAKLTKDMPNTNNMASGSQISTLVREANKKSKQRPVRLLLRDVGQLIQRLKPCFLMSPLSVSTYLDSDTCKFDVVIFDEASQIFPWDAIGAISRGKQVIVVGDSKQMPPSNFFNAGIVDEDSDEEDYDDDSLDFESILDLCTTTFDQNRLNWHYRSKTEDLIAFSNANFYDNTLVTFPSAHKDNADTGVDFYYVPDGIFDRKSKCNMIEAEKVVDLVFEHFKNHPDRSLGVVAFSISQQEAIEDIIQKRREKDDKFAEYFDSKRPEPFFVKNLETVQGDERDTIIFSVAYAKDSLGRFLHNFGPLNKKGGERRLNVAITRAKYNVKLVSSIKSFDIDLSKTSALGAKLLKDYLDCAEHGMVNVNKNLIVDPNVDADSDFEIEVYDVLKEAGYQVDMQVGCSGYRIDLGVRHPNKSDYVLAIECDGATYHSGKTTRDRDRLRQEVLEKLGWRFYRIWSTDWFLNKEIEKKKLISAVEKAIEIFDKKEEIDSDNKALKDSNQPQKQQEEQDFIVEEEIDHTELKSLFKTYNNYDIYSKKLPSFWNTVPDLVAMEAPITEELLLKKTVGFFGREKVTNVVRAQFNYNMRSIKNVFKIKDYYVIDKNMKIEMRIPKDGDEPRDILMISNDELASGMLVVIKNNIGISKDGLFTTMANLLGFTRKGNNIIYKLTDSLDQLIKLKQVKESDSELFLV